MSSANPAVFLSYASQDAEAAARIATTLRSIGVEVWFDVEGGLEQGDEWDAKIRQQIKDCVLFIAVVSANTESRHEGYFRLEWELAAQRAMSIASGVPFLLPVVIDNTPEQTALVPDRFKAVQWTKLPDGAVSDKVQARFLKLWSHRTGAPSPEVPGASRSSTSAPPQSAYVPTRRSRPWLIPAIIGVVAIAALAIWQPWSASETSPQPAAASPAATQNSEVESLLAEAWNLMLQPDGGRLELEAAERLCTRARDVAPDNPDVWATLSQVHVNFVSKQFDNSPDRRAAAREAAERALQLDSTAYEARRALMEYWAYAIDGVGQDRSRQMEIEKTARALLEEQPNDTRVRYTLAWVLAKRSQTFEEAVQQFERAAEDPNFAAVSWMSISWGRRALGEHQAAERAIQKSRAAAETPENLMAAVINELEWRGDLDAAEALVNQISQRDLQDEAIGSMAAWVQMWRHEPQDVLRYLQYQSREWISAAVYEGPVAYLSGSARQTAGQNALALRDYARALELVEEHLETEPDEAWLHAIKADLLHKLGRPEEAQRAYDLVREMNSTVIFTDVVLEPVDVVLDRLEAQFDSANRFVTAASLRHAYYYDPIREHPRFQALLARAEASPKHTPNPTVADSDSDLSSASKSDLPTTRYPLPATAGATAPAKSIAVLPFANRSANADDVYFTDGIHEDLLVQISRVRDIKSISRTSVMTYRDSAKRLKQIGQELGVATILEGAVQRAGNQVRISVKLIDAATDNNLWAESYTRDLTASNIFAIQTEIATAVATALQAVLSPEERQEFAKLPTENLAALEAFFRGQLRANEYTGEGYLASIPLFEQAIALDDQFAEAYAALGQVHLALIFFKGLPAAEQAAKAEPLIQRALELDPRLSRAYEALAGLQSDAADAEAAYQRAIELNPNSANAHMMYGNLLSWRGRAPEAVKLLQRALELDPRSEPAKIILGEALGNVGRFEEARDLLQQVVQDSPDFAQTYRSLGYLFEGHFAQYDEAIRFARQGVAMDPGNPQTNQILADSYNALGMIEEAKAWYQRVLALSSKGRPVTVARTELIWLMPESEQREAAQALLEAPDSLGWMKVWTIQILLQNDPQPDRLTTALSRFDHYFPELGQPGYEVKNDSIYAPIHYASLLSQMGQNERAQPLVDQLLALLPTMVPRGREGTRLRDVTLYLALDDTEQALTSIREWRAAGGRADLTRQVSFAPLFDHHEFQRINREMVAELAEQRANVEAWEAAGELAPIPPLPEETN